MRRIRRAVWPVLATLAVLGVLLGGVFPTRTYLAQRDSTQGAEQQLAVLREQNGALEERARLLHDDAEIERIAREQYNLVRPGEEAYAVLPPPTPTTAPRPTAAAAVPDDAARDHDVLEQVWDWIL